MIEDYLRYLSEFGFPVFVCLYFMFRFEKILKSNTDAIKEMIILIKMKGGK